MHNLTPHFTLNELTRSDTAARLHIDNTPAPLVIDNLTRLALQLERVRTVLHDNALIVSSGYRSPPLNHAVGGVARSAHLHGLAADFVCPAFGSPLEICHAIAGSDIEFHQVIMEGTWVHFAVPPPGVAPKREVLTANFGERTTYASGLQ